MHVAIPTAIGAVGFVFTAILKSPIPAMIALTVAAVGDYGTRGPFWALPGKFLTGGAAAAGIALINAMGAVGGFIGPYAVGYLKEQVRQLRERPVPCRRNTSGRLHPHAAPASFTRAQ